ncbi:uncharacterized protein, partial [Amphiura filiformis]|uniref:uncharacterized protein n=1 Tax=Amphiura filiformis TaxID=82378 RepID=UPI003B21D710
LSIDRTSASYKTKYGLGQSFTEELIDDLKLYPFSLNMDEATSETNHRVVTVLVSYFCPQQEEVVVKHLASFAVIKVNSQTLYNEVVALFDKFEIPWTNLVSILMDSCNVMRGSKSGLETRIRKEKAPHLLDIDGDSCHHAHNAAKILISRICAVSHPFCDPFDQYLEQLVADIFTDFKWSADLRENLAFICQALGIKYSRPEKYVSHRWLSIYDVSCDTIRMLDAFLLFYFPFLSKTDQALYVDVVNKIYNDYDVSETSKSGIKKLQQEMSKKNMTTDGKNRKKRIYEKLFFTGEKTKLMLKIYGCVLPILKKYVMLFQTQEPMIHKLNDKQKELFVEFLTCFIKPEVLTGATSASLVKLNIEDTKNHLPDTNVHLVKKITKSLPEKPAKELIGQLKEAYVKCAKKLQSKMPINNRLLKCISAIDPVCIGHTATLHHLLQLPEHVTTLFNEDQCLEYEQEVQRFQLEKDLIPDAGSKVRVDTFWAGIRKGGKYPNLSRMVLAILSCFHGPQVESSFSIMGNVLDHSKGQMNVSTFAAIQTIKYHIKSSKKSSLQYFKRKDHLYDPVNTRVCKNLRKSYKLYQTDLEKEKAESEEKRKEKGIEKPPNSCPTSKTQSKKDLFSAALKVQKKHEKGVKELGKKRVHTDQATTSEVAKKKKTDNGCEKLHVSSNKKDGRVKKPESVTSRQV